MDLRVVAHHEAGHAAVDCWFEHTIDMVTVRADGNADGCVVVDRADHDALQYEDALQNQVIFERAIMAAMAGEIAQRRFAPDSVDEDGSAGDRLNVGDYMDRLDAPTEEIRDAYCRLLHLRTEWLVNDLWPNIERIAAALLDRKTLTGAEVEAIFKAT